MTFAPLSQKTKEHGVTATAVEAYEDEMIPRGRDAVIQSNNNSIAVHDWEHLMQSPSFAKGFRQKEAFWTQISWISKHSRSNFRILSESELLELTPHYEKSHIKLLLHH